MLEAILTNGQRNRDVVRVVVVIHRFIFIHDGFEHGQQRDSDQVCIGLILLKK